MEHIEDKLKSYRLRKRRQQKITLAKECIKKFFMIGPKNEEVQTDTTLTIHNSEECTQSLGSSHESDNSLEEADLSSEKGINANTEDRYLQYILRFLYFAFWITLYIIAIELQFGIVFLMLSALIGIFLNTRTSPKRHNEISAYSVFNKNCESIDGTLKAEQFEREMGIR